MIFISGKKALHIDLHYNFYYMLVSFFFQGLICKAKVIKYKIQNTNGYEYSNNKKTVRYNIFTSALKSSNLFYVFVYINRIDLR